MSLTKYEQETSITYNQEEPLATVYTCNQALIRKLDKLCVISTEIIEENRDQHSKTYTFPKKWVKIKFPRVLTDEERAKRAENAIKNFGK